MRLPGAISSAAHTDGTIRRANQVCRLFQPSVATSRLSCCAPVTSLAAQLVRWLPSIVSSIRDTVRLKSSLIQYIYGSSFS